MKKDQACPVVLSQGAGRLERILGVLREIGRMQNSLNRGHGMIPFNGFPFRARTSNSSGPALNRPPEMRATGPSRLRTSAWLTPAPRGGGGHKESTPPTGQQTMRLIPTAPAQIGRSPTNSIAHRIEMMAQRSTRLPNAVSSISHPQSCSEPAYPEKKARYRGFRIPP